jgi:hypothetical protein
MVIKVLKLVRSEWIRDFIDDWPKYLALYNGQNAIPLDYIIRANVMMPAEATDPSFGEPRSIYASLRDEITARADHQASQYRADNAKVFELLDESVTGHEHLKMWLKPYATLRDGRGAWLNFKASAMAVPIGTIRTIGDSRTDCDASLNYSCAFTSSSCKQEVQGVARLVRVKTDKNYRCKKRNNDKRRPAGVSQDVHKAVDRYYKPDEWWKLDLQTREKILQIREKRKVSQISSRQFTIRWKNRKPSDTDEVMSDNEDIVTTRE